jgi:8-oxo-dGTP diphosphatase
MENNKYMKIIDKYLNKLNESKITKFIAVAGAVITKENNEGTMSVLLIRRSPTDHWKLIWEFPRGKMEKNEKILDALKREVKEETGLNVKIIKYIDKYEYIADQGTRKSTQYNYLCKIDPPNQNIKLSFEHDDFMWVSSIGEVELLVPSEMKKTISKVLNHDQQIVNYDMLQNKRIRE